MKGIIQKENYLGDDGKIYTFDVRGTDEEGYPEILIDAKAVGGRGSWARQSVKPYIGMRVQFVVSPTGYGYNYEIIKKKKVCA